MTYSLFAPPGVGDVLSIVMYALSEPYLFVGSTTWMTSGLIFVSAVIAGSTALPAARSTPPGRIAWRLLGWAAPKLALVLVYFGLGSMALATEILLRFHDVNAIGTEIQFRSGLGHLLVAALGIALLRPRLRGLDLRTWVEAHFWALAYLTFHVVVLTPPWFEFQFQGELIVPIARGGLAAALAVNVVLWSAVVPRRAAARAAV